MKDPFESIRNITKIHEAFTLPDRLFAATATTRTIDALTTAAGFTRASEKYMAMEKALQDNAKIMKTYNTLADILQSANIVKQFSAHETLLDYARTASSINPFSSDLSAFVRSQKTWEKIFIPPSVQDTIGKSLLHQVAITNNILSISQSMNAMEGLLAVSRSVASVLQFTIDQSIHSGRWGEINVIEKHLEEVDEITESIASDGYTEENKERLINRIIIFYNYIKGTKAFKAAAGVVSLIGFLIMMNEAFSAIFDMSPKEVVIAIEKKIEEGVDSINDGLESINEKLDQIMMFFSSKRYCDHTCNLRQNPNTKSNCLGIVKENQMVTIISHNKKWLCVAYIDDETREVKSGWVFKKYFSIVNE